MADLKTKIIVVAGPTASGKTSLGIEIAKAVDGEIISADSMQVYQGMSIATAAPTESERAEVPHHLVEFLSRQENYSVSDFCRLAKEKITDISSRGKMPVIVGGTGLFIDSLVDNIKFTEAETDFELRNELMQKSADELYDTLLKIDKEAALKIHKNNKSRVARAIEIYYTAGKTKTMQNEDSRKEESPFETLYLVLAYKNREILYDRINRRVDMMIKSGLIPEAERVLADSGSKTSAQAIGHKELKPYLDGEITLDTAVDNLKKETRHYSKRQITWFKRRENAEIIYMDSDENPVSSAVNKCREFIYGK